MLNNLVISFSKYWQNILTYMHDLYVYPTKLISVVIDIVIVAFVVAKILKFAKNSKFMQLVKGIVILLLVTWISGVFNLTIVHSVLTAILPSGVLALLIIFQPEIRRALEQLGTNKFSNFFGINKDLATRTKEDIYKIVIAIQEMAKTKTGALIVLERDIRIDDVISTGIELNSDISPQVLVNIFVPNTPLHDGAVIISNNKIIAAACILPLASSREISKELGTSDSMKINKRLGTRHRAAVGISKESDAIAIVVSEESGKVSIAKDGTLIADVKEEALKKILIKNIVTDRLENRNDRKISRLNKLKQLKKEMQKEEENKEYEEHKTDN